MSASRTLFLFGLLASSTVLGGQAHAAAAEGEAFPEIGGWGQAWGDEAPPAPASAPVRRPAAPPPSGYVPPPPAQALPTAVAPTARATGGPVAAPLPQGELGQVYPEVGGWGQAWGEDEVPAPTRPRAARAMPSTLDPLAGTNSVRAAAEPMAAPPQAERPRRTAASVPSAYVRMERAGDEGSSDAVGLHRPPRIIPRAVASANRKDEGDTPPVRMEADQVIYDRELGIVTAKGRVEMIQSGRTLVADTVSYNLKFDVMGASGNVVLTEPSGEVTHADYFELTGDFKNGVAQQIRVILADNSRLAAQSAQRVGGDRTDFDRAVYTACEPCRDHPERPPLWQAKAERVTHNQAEAQIEYRDAWLEFEGVPVFYTPYFSHPDPTVKRKSGFLTPVVGVNSTLGPSVTAPYYFVVSDSEDFTLAPRFMLPQTSTSGDVSSNILKRIQLAGEHRWRGVHGEEKTAASITEDRNTGSVRGHIESKGVLDLDETWRAGWQVQHQSDETYRSLYRIRTENDRPWLLTRPYVEGFGRRNYAMAEAMSFEGHRVIEDQSKKAMVLPHMIYETTSEPGWAGSYWTHNNDILSYVRGEGTDGQRFSHRTAWNLPILTPDGQVMAISASMRGDSYHSSRLATVASGDATSGRLVPEVSANWRYPFISTGTNVSQVVEPMAMVAVSPIGGNSLRIPNEDSLDFELDETNALRPNRLVGLDRVEGGLRGGYGLRWAAYPRQGGSISGQVAQGWRQHTDSTFGPGSGFTDTFSDFLGRVDVSPTGMVHLTDRVRLDKTSLQMRRNEAGVAVGPPALVLGANYGLLSSSNSAYPQRQYAGYTMSSALTEYWRTTYSLTQDLATKGGTVNWSFGTMYSDECFAVMATFQHYYSNNNDLASGYDAMLTVVLKSLGEAPFSLF